MMYGMKSYSFLVGSGEEKNEWNTVLLAKPHLKTRTFNSTELVVQHFGTRKYFVLEDYYGLWNREIEPEDRCFGEIIYGKNIQRPRFDLDLTPALVRETTDKEPTPELMDYEAEWALAYLTRAIDTIMKKKQMKDWRPEYNIIVCSSHGDEEGKEKRSFHVNIQGFKHQNHKEAGQFFEEVMEIIPKEYHLYFDTSVYSSIQCFRLWGNQKPGSGRVKIFEPRWKMVSLDFQRLINIRFPVAVFKEEEGDPEPYIKVAGKFPRTILLTDFTMINAFYSEATIPMEKIELEKPTAFQFDVEIKDKAGLATFLINLLSEARFGCFEMKELKKNILYLKRKKVGECPQCKRIHHSENACLLIHPNGHITFFCFRGKHYGKTAFVLGDVSSFITKEEEDTDTDEKDDEEREDDVDFSTWSLAEIRKQLEVWNLDVKARSKEELLKKIEELKENEPRFRQRLKDLKNKKE